MKMDQERLKKAIAKTWSHHMESPRLKKLQGVYASMMSHALNCNFWEPTAEQNERIKLDLLFHGVTTDTASDFQELIKEQSRLTDRCRQRLAYIQRVQKNAGVSGLELDVVEWRGKSIVVPTVMFGFAATDADEAVIREAKPKLVEFWVNAVTDGNMHIWESVPSGWKASSVAMVMACSAFADLADLYVVNEDSDHPALRLAFGSGAVLNADGELNLNGKKFIATRGYP
jgi:hypothetical protein